MQKSAIRLSSTNGTVGRHRSRSAEQQFPPEAEVEQEESRRDAEERQDDVLHDVVVVGEIPERGHVLEFRDDADRGAVLRHHEPALLVLHEAAPVEDEADLRVLGHELLRGLLHGVRRLQHRGIGVHDGLRADHAALLQKARAKTDISNATNSRMTMVCTQRWNLMWAFCFSAMSCTEIMPMTLLPMMTGYFLRRCVSMCCRACSTSSYGVTLMTGEVMILDTHFFGLPPFPRCEVMS